MRNLLALSLLIALTSTPARAQRLSEVLRTSDGGTSAWFGVEVQMNDRWFVVYHWGDGGSEILVFERATGEVKRFGAPEYDSPFSDSFGGRIDLRGDLAALTTYDAALVVDVAAGTVLHEIRKEGESYFRAALDDNHLYLLHDESDAPPAGQIDAYDLVTGERVLTLHSDQPDNPSGFGGSFSADAGRVLVGAPGDGPKGAAYVYDSATGELLLRLGPTRPFETSFGQVVKLDGNLALVMASGPQLTSRAHVFDVTTGQEVSFLKTHGQLADAVLEGGRIFLGSTDPLRGVEVYDALTGAWIMNLYVPIKDLGAFGEAVAAHGDEVLVGAPATYRPDGNNGVAYLFEIDEPLGQSYCGPAVPNSTGLPGRLGVYGSADVTEQNLTLVADRLPNGRATRVMVGDAQGLSMPPGTSGNLCLSGTIGRYDPINSWMHGAISVHLDPGALPIGAGVAIQPGETWNFQAWYRDEDPTPTSNFSEGVSITFQ